MFRLYCLFALFQYVNAACDNQCSGHGTCSIDDICQCYDNFGVGLLHSSGDCSDRVCPYDISWIDKPNAEGAFHKFAECSGKGICSRDTGECACLDGFEGKACQRSACPNSCSGHGTCEFVEDLPFATTYTDYTQYSGSTLTSYINTAPKLFPYASWDTRKTRTCVCDPNYGDIDCSKKLCPYGADVLDSPDLTHLIASDKYYKQAIAIFSAVPLSSLVGQTFALTFISKTNETFTTIPIVFKNPTTLDIASEFANDVKLALQTLPNRVIDQVSVEIRSSGVGLEIQVTYSGNNVQGPQNYLVVETDACNKPGCTPKITGLNVETRLSKQQSVAVVTQESLYYGSYECGRRGKCDYTTGICKCFLGYTGDNCNTLTTLA